MASDMMKKRKQFEGGRKEGKGGSEGGMGGLGGLGTHHLDVPLPVPAEDAAEASCTHPPGTTGRGAPAPPAEGGHHRHHRHQAAPASRLSQPVGPPTPALRPSLQ
ncbi:MAG: hypothetical protein Q9206_004623 [Seirophora lacunosa]